MNKYENSFYLFDGEAKQIPIIPMHGAPTEDTEGAVGLILMDVDAPGCPMYKCVEVTEEGKSVWEPFIDRLAYEENVHVPSSTDYRYDTAFVVAVDGERFQNGERLLFEITKDGETYQDEIESLGKQTNGECYFKSGTPYGWDVVEGFIMFPVPGGTTVSVKVCRPTVHKLASKFMPDSVVVELPVGTVFLDGYVSYDGKTRFYALQQGTYYVNANYKLYISEPCFCMLRFNEASVEITTISANCVRTLSAWALGEGESAMEDGMWHPINFYDLKEALQTPIKTVFEQLWLMAPDGMPYKVHINDNGQLAATPIE